MSDDRLIIRRTFDAPRERVYRAFTDPDAFEQWFVPDGMAADVHALEPEPGGRVAFTWTGGEDPIENVGTFVEVVENERLVSVEEVEGGELRLTYEFRDADGGTDVVVTQEFPGPVPDGAEEGWGRILDNLAEIL